MAMSREIVHYNIDSISKLGANINIIYGERSNGKSYQAKHKKGIYRYLHETHEYYDFYYDKEHIIERTIKEGSRFVLMRRWREEADSSWVEKYFDDVDIMKLTDNKYNCITVFKKRIYMSHYNSEDGKLTRGEHIGYIVALSTEQKYAGASFLDVTDIIFEEFMARGLYIHDEPNKLMNFYSTVDRKRGTTKLWLVGNSISRVCPYLTDWGLMDIIRTIKQGEIRSLWIPTGEVDDEGIPVEVKVAIEHCKPTGNSSYIIGSHSDMLNKGEWQSDIQPHLPKSYNCYKILYRIGFQYKQFKFLGEYIMDKETKDICWFVYPYDGEFDNKIVVFSDTIKTSSLWQRDIYNPLIKNDKLKNLLKTFRENNIFYANNLCGTDFKQAIDFEIRK